MNEQQLEALVIDEAMGELTEEVSALLAIHLAGDAEARSRAEQVRAALGVTRRTVEASPELFSAERMEPGSGKILAGNFGALLRKPAWRAASAVAAVLAIGLGSFFLGQRFSGGDEIARTNTETETRALDSPAAALSTGASAAESPWARYQLEKDGRLAVVAAVSPGGEKSEIAVP